MKIQVPDYLDKPQPLRLVLQLRAKQLYWFSALKRALRTFDNKNNHLSIPLKLSLPDDFVFQVDQALPRGLLREGRHYSSGYFLELSDLPDTVFDLVQMVAQIARIYFQADAVIRQPYLWRNHHLSPSYRFQDVYSDNFHQDLVVDQFNLQLFILLHDVTEDHGPLVYLRVDQQEKYLNKTRSRLDHVDCTGISFVGKRGDCLLLSTGYTLHRASSPAEGKHRDMLSIAFFPDLLVK